MSFKDGRGYNRGTRCKTVSKTRGDEWPNAMRNSRDWRTFFDPPGYAVAFTNAIKFAAAAANFSNFRDNGTACRRAVARARGNFALIRLYYRRSNYWKVFARIKTEWQDRPRLSLYFVRRWIHRGASWNLNVSLLGMNCHPSGKLNFH